MKVAAFDLGATFGWALGTRDLAKPGSTVVVPPNIQIIRAEQELCRGARPVRLFEFMRVVDHIIGRRRPDLVVYERPFARGADATRSLWGMAGVLEAIATNYKATVFDAAPPVTIKKWFTGNYKASKDEMIAKAMEKTVYVGPGQEHAADAVAVLLYTLENLEQPEKK